MNNSHAHQTRKFDENKVSFAAFQAFLNIVDKWDLSRDQQLTLLGLNAISTFHLWKNNIKEGKEFKLPKDTLERISYLLGIYKALNILLSNKEAANSWIKKPNSAPLFNNRSALDKMLAGNVVDLADVRRYLDAQRG